jgi:hypothetical protein
MVRLASACALVLLACQTVLGDGMSYQPYRYRGFYLPPERHVIEVVQPPYSGNFIINGTAFTAKTAACTRWAAGERIRLIAGDWHGRCVDAVFYNYYRRSSCEMWCR